MEILLDVWREACRHIEITESADRIARILAPRFPVDALVVRRIDLDHKRLETVTVGRPDGERPTTAASRTELSPPQLRALLEWSSRMDIAGSRTRDAGSVVALVAPTDARGDLLAGPLRTDSGVIGALVAVS